MRYRTFRVKASDQAANRNTAVRHFTVDATPPQTTITSGPASGQTKDRAPTFAFKSSEAGSTFACSLDHAAYRPLVVGGPWRYQPSATAQSRLLFNATIKP